MPGLWATASPSPIPRVSTWQRRGLRPVVTVEIIDQNRQQLLEPIVRLDRSIESARPWLSLGLILLDVHLGKVTKGNLISRTWRT